MCDLEDVAERVTHHRSPIAIRGVPRLLQARRPRIECPPINNIGVFDVDVEKGGKQIAFTGWRHHDESVAYTDLGRTVGMDIDRGVKDGAEEPRFSGHVADDHCVASPSGTLSEERSFGSWPNIPRPPTFVRLTDVDCQA
jgi:hypothetical protein